MRLEMMNAGDVEIRIQCETDPVMMAELGGPRPVADIERAHARSLAHAAEGKSWPFKVILDQEHHVAGSIIVFPNRHEGEDLFEIGWMIFPEFQNRGIAGEAVRLVLERARAEGRFGRLNAFPAVTNGQSNRICEKNGFTNLGLQDFKFAGRRLRCNRWRVELWLGAVATFGTLRGRGDSS